MRRGPVGEKKSEGGYASLSSPVSQARPPPPLSLVFTRQNAFLQSKSPLYMICVVNCYGQRTQPQPLARAVQTERDGMVRLLVGERRLTGHEGHGAGWLTAHIHARGDCIQSKGRNAFTSYTNYLHRTPALARTPQHVPQSRLSCTHRAALTRTHALTRHARTTHFSLPIVTFLLLTCAKRRIFALV